MLQTHHWAATGPVRLRDYHVEYALEKPLTQQFHEQLLAARGPADVPWALLRALFSVWKNDDFTTATDYGTWHMNHDPRDGSANVEIGALCMGGEGVSCSGSWGSYPFTIAHAWIAVGISARIAHLKGEDPFTTFDDSVDASRFQNGPLHVVSTHAERALQTKDSDAVLRPSFGYFIFSGDPDSRWDLAVLDASRASALATPAGARSAALSSAAWLRSQVKAAMALPMTDLWGLDKPAT